jgi:hypothetical protein
MKFVTRLALAAGVTLGVLAILQWRKEPRQAPPPPPPVPPEPQIDPLDEVRRLARAGEKLEAIKRYREITGCDLKTAREAVEAMS